MIKIKNVMTKDVFTTSKESRIVEAAKLMASKSVSGLVVVDENVPIGVVSENDVVRGFVNGSKRIGDVMSRDFVTISPYSRFSDILIFVGEKKIKRFPVVENGHLVGLVTESDIIESMRDITRYHEFTQDMILTVFGLATAFFLFYSSPLGMLFFG